MQRAIIGILLGCLAQMPASAALRFNGVDGKVTCTNEGNLVGGIQALTVSLKMRTTTGGQTAGLAAIYDSSAKSGWRVYMDSKTVVGDYRWDNNNYTSCTFNDADFTDGVWRSLTFAVSASGSACYTDGIQDATGSWTGVAGTSAATVDLIMGVREWGKGVEYYTGDLDEVRIFEDTRTADEVLAYRDRRFSGTEPGLIGYFRLDEGTGTAVNDLQDNATNSPGTHSGGVTHVDSSPTTYGE